MNCSTLQAVPVYRASLPQAERLLPYLRTIDANHWYTNRGELVLLLEARLEDRLGLAGAQLVTTASGTAALEGAILATAGRATAERPLALLPAYTFVATAAAVEQCGYAPYLLDVDPDTWALDAGRLLGHPILKRAGVVVPVAPYGRSVDQAGWAAFRSQANVPVVIDAAASFEALAADPTGCVGVVPVALSFQATKAFSSGEGGAVVWSDRDGLRRVLRASNFGMLGKRESTAAGTNGKLSEYHAAVGLASLDAWEETCQANRRTAEAYSEAARMYGLVDRVIIAPHIASNYALVDAGSPSAANNYVAALAAQNIESRRWYGRGLHHEPYFASAQRDPLPTTDRLAPSVIGIPIYPGIATADIERTVATAARVLGRAQKILSLRSGPDRDSARPGFR